jgi:hypothetical protein
MREMLGFTTDYLMEKLRVLLREEFIILLFDVFNLQTPLFLPVLIPSFVIEILITTYTIRAI